MLPRSGGVESRKQNPSLLAIVVPALRKNREERGTQSEGRISESKAED